jgi:hypothetical protein
MNRQRMPTAALAEACREETEKVRRGEPSRDEFCFELIGRALRERDHAAWEAIRGHYRRMVLAWVRQHPMANAVQEEDDYWVTRAFERFWAAIGPERFDSFPSLAALLQYLKMCVHSVLLDEVRARGAAPTESLDELGEGVGEGPDIEELAVGQLAGLDLWNAIVAELTDEAERLVVYLSFVRDIKPAEIQRRHPDRYPAVGEVYRIMRNALDRLRRSARIRDFSRRRRE